MSKPIEELYFNWLCSKVSNEGGPNYTELLRILHRTEFVWLVLGDDNRVEDGIELRLWFTIATGEFGETWHEEPCSLLEMLVAFSKRAQFQSGLSSREWFTTFLQNLWLDDYIHVRPSQVATIENILNVFVWRLYDKKGNGGLFPLTSTRKDQRKLEIWYQFSEYLKEKGYILEG